MSASTAFQSDLRGLVIHGHEITTELGKGGMGRIFLARHQTLGVQRVIKVIGDRWVNDPTSRERFRREAVALARLSHASIVGIIDFGQLDDGLPWLCMEYVDGPDLERLLLEDGRLAPRDALGVLLQLARALSYAHSQKVIHRDLKPGNVLVRERDPAQVKIIDFGLARLISDQLMTKLTADGTVVGSPLYMAPEQLRGDELTPAVDVYAWGGMAYSCFSGKPAFVETTLPELVHAQCYEDPVPLSSRAGVGRQLDDLVSACLAKNPEARPSMAEVVDSLERAAPAFLEARVAFSATVVAEQVESPSALVRLLLDGPGATTTALLDSLRVQGQAIALEIGEALPEARASVERIRNLQRASEELGLERAIEVDAARLGALDADILRVSRDIDDVFRQVLRVVEAATKSPHAPPQLYAELQSVLTRIRAATGASA